MRFHQLHGFIAHVSAVLYCGNAGAYGALHAFIAMRMGSDFKAEALGHIYNGLDFIFKELRGRTISCHGEHATGSCNLDEIGAAFYGQPGASHR